VSRALVAVAHNDDETLWAGGYLAAHPGTDVAVCTVDTRPAQERRIERFYRACAVLGATPHVVAGAAGAWDIDTRPIVAFAAQYDEIITHNARGEYGHPAHVKLHHALAALGLPMRVFSYGLVQGEPIDYTRKLAALECYEDPKLVPWLHKHFNFNLAYETLVTVRRYRPPRTSLWQRRAARSP
jgi:hypothetical protein